MESKNILVEELKKNIIRIYRKIGDNIALKSPNGKLKCSWTGNELAKEIEINSEFGISLVNNLLQLTIDLVKRDKLNINE